MSSPSQNRSKAPTGSQQKAAPSRAQVPDNQSMMSAGVSQAIAPPKSMMGMSQAPSQYGKKAVIDNDPNSLQNVPIRQYLDQTVVPILLQAMAEVSKERPQYPMEFII